MLAPPPPEMSIQDNLRYELDESAKENYELNKRITELNKEVNSLDSILKQERTEVSHLKIKLRSTKKNNLRDWMLAAPGYLAFIFMVIKYKLDRKKDNTERQQEKEIKDYNEILNIAPRYVCKSAEFNSGFRVTTVGFKNVGKNGHFIGFESLSTVEIKEDCTTDNEITDHVHCVTLNLVTKAMLTSGIKVKLRFEDSEKREYYQIATSKLDRNNELYFEMSKIKRI